MCLYMAIATDMCVYIGFIKLDRQQGSKKSTEAGRVYRGGSAGRMTSVGPRCGETGGSTCGVNWEGPPLRRRLGVQEALKRSPTTHRHLGSAVLSGFSVGARVSVQGLASWVVFTGPSPPRGGGVGVGRGGGPPPKEGRTPESKEKEEFPS